MYGLPQGGKLAYDQLCEHLKTHGYTTFQHIPGIFKHNLHDTTFVLLGDDFGIKYSKLNHLNHLYRVLRKNT